MIKATLAKDFQFDIPNAGSATIKKGTPVEGIILVDTTKGEGGGTPLGLATKVNTPKGSVGVDIPWEYINPKAESEGKGSYNWLYLAAAAGLVFWYVTRGKSRRNQVMPAGYGGIGGVGDEYSFRVPTWALNYLINNDPTNLADEEIKQLDEFAKEVYKLTKSDISMGSWDENPRFSYRNDVTGNLAATEIVDVVIKSRKK